MKKTHSTLIVLLLVVTLLLPSFAISEELPCDKCDKQSEFSWNPENQYVTERLSRFYSLDDLINESYLAGDFATTKVLANEYLELASAYRCNWNYGNAIHDANRILGLISLKNGKIDEAASSLLKSGKTPGSPQLDSFGPELDLANLLLHEGRVEEVAIYLNDIKSFWEKDRGLIEKWLNQVENGESPELSRFSQDTNLLSTVFIFVSLLWPIIIVALFTLKSRKRIRKVTLFCIASIFAGYIAMFTFNLISQTIITIVIGSLAKLGNHYLVAGFVYGLLSLSYIAPFLTTIFIFRYFKVSIEKSQLTSG